ncbi:MAG: NAD(P)/FAD-dependent oxidoreductase [Verrucomicrobiales bacterium]|nr:NAD(P)/FAD-dependent oxidoreductase [Verrucomicrobiales bacterium]MCP5556843.1 NAD(P)/FAD-dependent oxidoreductase [Verrucomicrobiaceae bacterium]
MADAYDAIIIGSGPNGLAAAITLAQKQWRVLVLEAADTIGGGTRTKGLTLPGFHHDVCSAVHPTAVVSPFFQSLDLARHGLEFIQPELPLAHPLANGRAAVLHRSLDETVAGLGRDGWRYHALFETLITNSAKLYPDILDPLSLPRHPFLMARFGVGAMLPARTLAKLAFRDEPARALLAGNAAHSVLPLESPFTSAIGLMLQMTAHAAGWPVAKGGSQAIAEALAAELKSLGGEIRCGHKVTFLAELPASRVVLFDTSPRQLIDIAGSALPSGYQRRLHAFKHGPGVFKIDYALDGPVPWLNESCRKAGTVHVGGTLDEIAHSEAQACHGEHPDRPFVLVSQPTVCDPSRAPEGKHVLWAYCHVPAGSTRDMSHIINAQIERFAPGFRDRILAAHTLNTVQMEAYNGNYIGGDIVGGMANWAQLLTRPIVSLNPYATPNPRLYLCSASTPPAGGVHGMCGSNAARAVLRRHRA